MRARLVRERRGTVAVVAAASAAVMLGFVGLATDSGNLFYTHRRQQGANDLAAIAAASNLGEATSAAVAAAASNGFEAAAVTGVVTGTYTGDPAIPVHARFVPGTDAAANAALVTMGEAEPLFFAGVVSLLGGKGNAVPIGTQAVAVNTQAASFTVGSRLAQLNGGVANAVLGGLLGTNLSLSVMDYNSLLGARIDLFQFSGALATELGVTGVTYNQLFSGSVTVAQFAQALQIAGLSTQASAALQQIAVAVDGNQQVIDLSRLIGFGPFGYYSTAGAAPMAASVSAMQLLTAAAAIGDGGRNQIALNFDAGIPGIAGVSGTMTVGEPPVSTTMISIGREGASAHTAQTRLLLNATLVGTLGSALVNVPLYLELASATAQLSSLSCNALVPTSSTASVAATPAVASAWIGTVSPSLMTDFSTEPTVSPATLVNLGLVNVRGAANAAITNLQPTTLTFSYAQIENASVQSTSTQDYFASLFASLLGKLQLSATLAGLPVPVPQLAVSALGGMLAGVATPVDQLLSDVLQTAGVELGVADVWMTGIRCAPAVVAQ